MPFARTESFKKISLFSLPKVRNEEIRDIRFQHNKIKFQIALKDRLLESLYLSCWSHYKSYFWSFKIMCSECCVYGHWLEPPPLVFLVCYRKIHYLLYCIFTYCLICGNMDENRTFYSIPYALHH